MSRPQHLTCPNTAAGISRINAEQARYDEDPEAYEAEMAQAEQDAMLAEQELAWAEKQEAEAMAEAEAEAEAAVMDDLPF